MILGLDFGSRRIGVAISDQQEHIAVGAGTVSVGEEEALQYLHALVQERGIRLAVVGLPLALSGRETEQTRLVRKFMERLQRTLSLPVVAQDERLSTVAAGRSGFGRLDERSAVLILQTYLDRQQHEKP